MDRGVPSDKIIPCFSITIYHFMCLNKAVTMASILEGVSNISYYHICQLLFSMKAHICVLPYPIYFHFSVTHFIGGDILWIVICGGGVLA